MLKPALCPGAAGGLKLAFVQKDERQCTVDGGNREEEAGVGVPERSSGGSDSEASMSSAPRR
jgi:hypothetical protein